ncbi:MAG TPA: VanW family protein, partial [Bacillota bacterium]|nr:VanW family protein [Bacillota bacterium]
VYLELPAGKDEANNYNASVAAGYINGTVLQPGKEFSFNDVVGPRTEARGFILGYNSAGRPDVGGGICRTSTVLYQAVLKAGLAVLERHPHVPPVDYVPKGMDATIQWGICDLRFVNTLDVPLEVTAAMEVLEDKYELWTVFRSVETAERVVKVSVSGAVYQGLIIDNMTYLPVDIIPTLCRNINYSVIKEKGMYTVNVGQQFFSELDGSVKVSGALGVLIQARKLAGASGALIEWLPPDMVVWRNQFLEGKKAG